MRKLFKSVISMALAAAMVVTTGAVNAPAKAAVNPVDGAQKMAEATSYNAYTAFQIGGYWVSRASWNDSAAGRNDVRETGDKFVNEDNGKSYDYDYSKEFLAFNGDDQTVNDGGIKDAVMTQNGTYTMEMTKLNVNNFTNAGDALWNMLHISTDIPMTVANVKCTDVKVYLDGSTTPYATLAEAKPNLQKSTNLGCYDFFIFDGYSGNHGTKGVLDNKKFTKFPTKGLKIEFTISGVNFSAPKQSVALPNGLVAGQKFAYNGVQYKVLERSMDNGAKGAVAVAGLDTAGAKKTSIKLPTVVNNGTNSYNVTGIANKAFKGAKKLKKITISSSIKTMGTSAFAGCKNLTSVTMGKSVKSVSKQAFSGCAKLKTVKFGASVKSIAASAFQGCKSLKAVKLGKKVKSIGKSAFAKCTKLNKITVYQKVKVSKNAFKGCKKTIKVAGAKKFASYTKKKIVKSGYKKVK